MLVQVVGLLLVGRRLPIVERVVVLLPVAGHGRLVVRGLVDQSRVVRDSGARVGAIAVAAAQERGRRVVPRQDALQSLDEPAVNALVVG